MNKKLIISTAAIFAFVACSEDSGNVSSAETSTATEVLSEADAAFMKSLLKASGEGKVASDGIDFDEASPTDEQTLGISPAAVSPFTTEAEIVYSEINDAGSCWVNMYKAENGISYSKSKKEKLPGSRTILEHSDDTHILLKENEGSLFRQNLLYKSYAGNAELCKADSVTFVSECNKKGGIYEIYSKGCSEANPFEASCVMKVPNDTKLEFIASAFQEECESFVTNLPEVEALSTITCQGDTENGMVCDTTRNN